jgi:hypothetical protein
VILASCVAAAQPAWVALLADGFFLTLEAGAFALTDGGGLPVRQRLIAGWEVFVYV